MIQVPDNINQYSITLGNKVKTTKDTKSRSRVINFPFEFPDNTKGVIIILRLKDEEWIPNEDINSILIKFNDKKQR